jgi:hypothetical protein
MSDTPRRPTPRLAPRFKAVDRFGLSLLTALGLSASACQEPLTAEEPIIPGALYDTANAPRPDATSSPDDTSSLPDDTFADVPDVTSLPRCGGDTPFTINNQPTGFATCESGAFHRAFATQCPDNPNSSCTQDSDCGSSICLCQESGNVCIYGSCTLDSDCGPALLCVQVNGGCGSIYFTCQTPEDTCDDPYDCSDNPDPWTGSSCISGSNGNLECGDIFCGGGRPFLIDHAARLAPQTARRDWCTSPSSPLPSAEALAALTPRERALLADHWTAIGLMEHASVAAFARSAMQLMSLGAPPALLIDTQAAMLDETHHATLAFALASVHAAAPIGPGPLPIDGALNDSDLPSILYNTIHEGCIGEATAAIEAAEAAERVQDPALRAALLRISDDESRHAALAWRTLQWALAAFPDARPFIASTLRDALTPTAPTSIHPEDDALARLGIVRGSLSAELKRQAIARVIQPCAQRLLEQPISSTQQLTLS